MKLYKVENPALCHTTQHNTTSHFVKPRSQSDSTVCLTAQSQAPECVIHRRVGHFRVIFSKEKS